MRFFLTAKMAKALDRLFVSAPLQWKIRLFLLVDVHVLGVDHIFVLFLSGAIARRLTGPRWSAVAGWLRGFVHLFRQFVRRGDQPFLRGLDDGRVLAFEG